MKVYIIKRGGVEDGIRKIIWRKNKRDRVGAYAIILDDKYNVAVIKTPTGYFLPGGGLYAHFVF